MGGRQVSGAAIGPGATRDRPALCRAALDAGDTGGPGEAPDGARRRGGRRMVEPYPAHDLGTGQAQQRRRLVPPRRIRGAAAKGLGLTRPRRNARTRRRTEATGLGPQAARIAADYSRPAGRGGGRIGTPEGGNCLSEPADAKSLSGEAPARSSTSSVAALLGQQRPGYGAAAAGARRPPGPSRAGHRRRR